jgi:hypothetical protein
MSVLLFYCTNQGNILYADPAVHQWGLSQLEGKHFVSLLPFDEDHKGEHFLEASRSAKPDDPTLPWELIIGSSTNYTIATFRGFSQDTNIFIIACTQPKELNVMQQAMDELTSELVESQREVRRQNHALQTALYDHRQLLRRVMAMTVPTVPIWDAALVLSLLANSRDKQETQFLLKEIWHRAGRPGIRYVILDMSSMQIFSKDMIRWLLLTTQILQTYAIEPLLANAGSGFVQAMTQFGFDLELQELDLFGDVLQAIAYIGSQDVANE